MSDEALIIDQAEHFSRNHIPFGRHSSHADVGHFGVDVLFLAVAAVDGGRASLVFGLGLRCGGTVFGCGPAGAVLVTFLLRIERGCLEKIEYFR